MTTVALNEIMPQYPIQCSVALRRVRLATASELTAVIQQATQAMENNSPLNEEQRAAAMRAELDSVAQSVRQIHHQLQQEHQRQQDLISDVRSAVVELAMAVTAQVLGESEITKERVVELVSETLEQLPQEQSASVFLHPMDAELLEEMDIEEASGRQLLQVGADPNVARGTCRIEGPHYGYVNHWKHYLATVRRNLLDQLND